MCLTRNHIVDFCLCFSKTKPRSSRVARFRQRFALLATPSTDFGGFDTRSRPAGDRDLLLELFGSLNFMKRRALTRKKFCFNSQSKSSILHFHTRTQSRTERSTACERKAGGIGWTAIRSRIARCLFNLCVLSNRGALSILIVVSCKRSQIATHNSPLANEKRLIGLNEIIFLSPVQQVRGQSDGLSCNAGHNGQWLQRNWKHFTGNRSLASGRASERGHRIQVQSADHPARIDKTAVADRLIRRAPVERRLRTESIISQRRMSIFMWPGDEMLNGLRLLLLVVIWVTLNELPGRRRCAHKKWKKWKRRF